MRVYYFASEKYGLDDLRRRRLKISRFDELNDPFELLPAALPTKAHRDALAGFTREINARWGVLCFSRAWDNALLWSHYADRHRGLCLGFDIPRKCGLPINYVNGRLHFDIERQLSHSTRDNECGRKLLLTKYSDWRYENEVRVIVRLEEQDRDSGLFFADFGDQLRLRTVIVGARSTLSRTQLAEVVSPKDTSISFIKARVAFNTFTIVRQRDRRFWP